VEPREAGGEGSLRGVVHWLVVVALIVVVIAMMLLTVLVAVAVAVVVIFVVPMSLMQLPASLIMIVVRVAPVGACIGRAVPASLNPAVVVAIGNPVSLDPSVARARLWSANLNPERRWRSSDVHRNLRRA